MIHGSLATSPDGSLEASRMLHDSFAHSGGSKSPARLRRQTNPMETVATITVALDQAVSDGRATSTGSGLLYTLTDVGLQEVRQHPQSRYL